GLEEKDEGEDATLVQPIWWTFQPGKAGRGSRSPRRVRHTLSRVVWSDARVRPRSASHHWPGHDRVPPTACTRGVQRRAELRGELRREGQQDGFAILQARRGTCLARVVQARGAWLVLEILNRKSINGRANGERRVCGYCAGRAVRDRARQ